MCTLATSVDSTHQIIYHVYSSRMIAMVVLATGTEDQPLQGCHMAYDKDGREVKEKDIGQIVRYLSNTFNQATSKLERPFRSQKTGPNEAYIMQTEFAYIINELVQAPRCMQQKYISDCNDFIDQVIMEVNNQTTTA